MSGIQDFCIFEDDFIGGRTITATVGEGDWKITDTSSAGTPTYALVTPSATGEVALTMSSTSEVQNVCLDFGDILAFDIDNVQRVEMRVKINAVFTTGSTLAFGLQSARNDDTDATANNAQFKMVGATSTTLVYCESDDGTTDKDDISSGVTLGSSYKKFVIDFTDGKSDVRFYIDGQRVAASTVFTMAAATSSLQPFVQIQKAANTNVNAVTIDYVKVVAKR